MSADLYNSLSSFLEAILNTVIDSYLIILNIISRVVCYLFNKKLGSHKDINQISYFLLYIKKISIINIS